jgi:hypothetical protein
MALEGRLAAWRSRPAASAAGGRDLRAQPKARPEAITALSAANGKRRGGLVAMRPRRVGARRKARQGDTADARGLPDARRAFAVETGSATW